MLIRPSPLLFIALVRATTVFSLASHQYFDYRLSFTITPVRERSDTFYVENPLLQI